MTDKKVDPLAQTGFAQKPADPLAETSVARQPVDPLAQTGFEQLPADPLAQTGFAEQAPSSTAFGGRAGIDPLAQTAHSAAPVAPAPAPRPPRPSGLRWAILALVLVGAVVAGIVLASKSEHPRAATGSAAPAAPSLPPPPPPPAPREYAGTVEGLLAIQDRALAAGTSAPFETLLAPDIVGIGIAASEVRIGADTNYELVRHVIGTQVQSFTKKVWIGRTDHAAWVAAVYTFADGHQVELSEVLSEHDREWRIDAWHWAVPLANGRAYELAQAGMLPKPGDFPRQDADTKVTAVLGDRAAYVQAISPRPDAFAFGSAPGEIMAGGPAITRAFSHMDATFALESGPVIGHPVDGVVFAAANVNFTNKAGTQTFRVLLVLVNDTIVQAQWSNAAASADSTTGSGRSASPPAR